MVTALRVGVSEHGDAATAAREAACGALREAVAPVAGVVFATWQHDPDEVAAALATHLGELPWIGCTTVGIIAGESLVERGVALGILDAPGASAGVGLGSPVSGAERAAGRAAVSRALSDMPLPPVGRSRLILLFADSTGGNVAEVVRGALAEGGAGVVWAGGGGGDNLGRSRAVQFMSGRACRDCVVALGVDFHSTVGVGVQHGWSPYGPPAMVTRSSGVVVQELEYRSAFEVYREAAEATGERVDEGSFSEFAMLHPLGIPQARPEYLIRDPVAVEPGGGLRCVGEVPDGALVRFMRAQPEAVVAAAGRAATLARGGVAGALAGSFVFDCVSRYLILGDGFRREVDAYRAVLGDEAPVIGCLTYGEVGAFGNRVPQLHNKTAVVVALPR